MANRSDGMTQDSNVVRLDILIAKEGSLIPDELDI